MTFDEHLAELHARRAAIDTEIAELYARRAKGDAPRPRRVRAPRRPEAPPEPVSPEALDGVRQSLAKRGIVA